MRIKARFFKKSYYFWATSSVVERFSDKEEADGSIPSTRTRKEFASGFGSSRFARRLIRKEFWAKKSVGDFVRRKEKFLIIFLNLLLWQKSKL